MPIEVPSSLFFVTGTIKWREQSHRHTPMLAAWHDKNTKRLTAISFSLICVNYTLDTKYISGKYPKLNLTLIMNQSIFTQLRSWTVWPQNAEKQNLNQINTKNTEKKHLSNKKLRKRKAKYNHHPKIQKRGRERGHSKLNHAPVNIRMLEYQLINYVNFIDKDGLAARVLWQSTPHRENH